MINAKTWKVYHANDLAPAQTERPIKSIQLTQYEPFAKFGVVYGYYEKASSDLVYIGHATSLWSLENALQTRHRSHLNGNLLIDKVLRRCGPDEFEIKAICVITTGAVKKEITEKERELIQKLKPIYNVRHR